MASGWIELTTSGGPKDVMIRTDIVSHFEDVRRSWGPPHQGISASLARI
ncbi:hypothetical protein PDIG_56460 [Penicillium digitatum PHI26]|uniref:Uncharacterized protein n=2 Tax=Penicillium digitatum TaxID=36651 RepID=K9FPU4_PEND2|nr:hypothetical protein PDIP_66020 [Penicillium digitatum Pd1]EKV09091.1 hypothetical protein PDIP_66020 [Penicillium digitatum Pd1]EKV10357.1 hypothetical protein PDIG_56460 [Penicillium digitatum PHI26]